MTALLIGWNGRSITTMSEPRQVHNNEESFDKKLRVLRGWKGEKSVHYLCVSPHSGSTSYGCECQSEEVGLPTYVVLQH